MMREFHSDCLYMIEKDGIISIFFKVEEINLELAKKIVKQRKEFCLNSDALLYVDWTKIKVVDNKARAYFGLEDSGKKVKALAIYVDSVFSHFLASFILKVNLQDFNVPKKIFTNKTTAISWLKSITTILMILFKIY